MEEVRAAAEILCQDRARLVSGLENFHRARKLLTVRYEDVSLALWFALECSFGNTGQFASISKL